MDSTTTPGPSTAAVVALANGHATGPVDMVGVTGRPARSRWGEEEERRCSAQVAGFGAEGGGTREEEGQYGSQGWDRVVCLRVPTAEAKGVADNVGGAALSVGGEGGERGARTRRGDGLSTQATGVWTNERRSPAWRTLAAAV